MNFLQSVYDCKNPRSAVKVILEHFDDLMSAGNFEECDQIFSEVDVKLLEPSGMVSFLGITWMAREKFKNRANFYDRVMAEMASRNLDSQFLQKYKG